MKKIFKTPQLEIIDVTDVIMTSGTAPAGNNSDVNDNEGGY